MNKRTVLWSVSSLVFIAAGAACFLAGIFGFLTGGLENIEYKDLSDLSGLRSCVTFFLVICLITGILGLAGSVVSIATCGSPCDSYGVKETWFDRIFTEVQLALGVGVSAAMYPAGLLVINWFWNSRLLIEMIISHTAVTEKELEIVMQKIYAWWGGGAINPQYLSPNVVTLILGLCMIAVVLAFDLLVIQAIAKKLKNRHFWRETLIGWIVCKLVAFAERDDKIYRKVFLIVIASVLLCMTRIGAAPVIILAIVFLPRYLNKFIAIRDGVAEIKGGNLTHQLTVDGNGQLDALAADINEISKAQHEAIQQEMKTQRLKTELITNVSHDLKTPLTSLITYVDLLKQEGLDSEKAPEYLEVLDEKTRCLTRLTEDLFDAAKASSGDIPVNLDQINVLAIVNQALAEMEDHLESNNIQIIVTDKTKGSCVMADGRHLWRVFENLLGNISKYALPGSRAYIDLLDRGDKLQIDFKNMSRDALNIDAEELMERFRRGDESRTTEGSGLGLAIARDLVRLMHGRFDLTIDGDLFKATIALPTP